MALARSILALMLGGFALAASADGLADFENFAEGFNRYVSFTDPKSGIVFSEPTTVGNNFMIEFNGPWPSRPRSSPGNFLSSNGLVPGPDFGFPGGFGFRALLPESCRMVSLDVLYVLKDIPDPKQPPEKWLQIPGDVTLTGFDENDDAVASDFFHTERGKFDEWTIRLGSSTADIRSFRVSVTPEMSTAFDNIQFSTVPEPALPLLAVAGLLLDSRMLRSIRRPSSRPSQTSNFGPRATRRAGRTREREQGRSTGGKVVALRRMNSEAGTAAAILRETTLSLKLPLSHRSPRARALPGGPPF